MNYLHIKQSINLYLGNWEIKNASSRISLKNNDKVNVKSKRELLNNDNYWNQKCKLFSSKRKTTKNSRSLKNYTHILVIKVHIINLMSISMVIAQENYRHLIKLSLLLFLMHLPFIKLHIIISIVLILLSKGINSSYNSSLRDSQKISHLSQK